MHAWFAGRLREFVKQERVSLSLNGNPTCVGTPYCVHIGTVFMQAALCTDDGSDNFDGASTPQQERRASQNKP